MPLYNNTYPPYSIGQGEGSPLVKAEQLGAGNFSSRVAISSRGGSQARPIVVYFIYATQPASVQYDIYVAVVDDTGIAGYTKVGSTTNVSGDQVTLNMAAAGGNSFRFLCVKEVISPGVNATVTAHQLG